MVIIIIIIIYARVIKFPIAKFFFSLSLSILVCVNTWFFENKILSLY